MIFDEINHFIQNTIHYRSLKNNFNSQKEKNNTFQKLDRQINSSSPQHKIRYSRHSKK